MIGRLVGFSLARAKTVSTLTCGLKATVLFLVFRFFANFLKLATVVAIHAAVTLPEHNVPGAKARIWKLEKSRGR